MRATPKVYALAAALTMTVLAAGCSEPPTEAAAPASAPAASTPTPTVASSTPTTASTPTDSPPSPSPSVTKRTASDLRKALLGLKDVPAGFDVDRGDDGGGKASSNRSSCAPLVKLLNAAKVQGSQTEVQVSFSGGQEGPFVNESLDAMGDAATARSFVAGFRTAVKKCRTLSLTIDGVGTSPLTVREISFADIGDTSFAARFSATRGALEAHSKDSSSSKQARKLETSWSAPPSSGLTPQTPKLPPKTQSTR